MKCPLKTTDKELLRITRFKKAYPTAKGVSDTTILGFLEVEKKIKKSIDKQLDKILMLK